MKKLKHFLIILLFISALSLYGQAEKVTGFAEVLRPYGMQLDGSHIYVVDNDIIRLYDMKDYKFLKIIGKKGSGPGEFPFSPQVTIYPDLLVVNTWGKFISFSREGDYKSEKKLSFPVSYFEYPFLPVGKNYVGEKNTPGERTISICIFDKDLKEIKSISKGLPQRLPPPPLPGAKKADFHVIGESWSYVVYKDRIYLSDTRKGLYLEVFDHTGKKLYEINHPYTKEVVNDAFKKNYMKRLSESPGWKRNKQFYNYKFNEHFPAFAAFKLNDNKIYLYTYNKKGGKFEIIVMDLKGKILKRAFAGPLTPNTSRFKNQFSIHDSKFYFLFENETDDVWELHKADI